MVEPEQNNESLLAKQQLLEREEDMNKLIYHLSHDLQQPVTTILGYLDLLRIKYSSELGVKGNYYLENISESAKLLTTYFDRLALLSRIGKNKVTKDIDANKLLEEICTNLNHEIDKFGINITIGNLPFIRGNPLEIKILFEELIKNALLYRSVQKPPHIRISGTRNKKYVEFLVEDNGIGISSKHHQEIFTLLFRLHDQNTYPGQGIGLTMCEKIVKQYQGEIKVQSNPGEGSLFMCYLLNENIIPGEDGRI